MLESRASASACSTRAGWPSASVRGNFLLPVSNGEPTTPSCPMIAKSPVRPSLSPHCRAMTAVVGKPAWLGVRPLAYTTAPLTSRTRSRCGHSRRASSGRSAASRKFAAVGVGGTSLPSRGVPIAMEQRSFAAGGEFARRQSPRWRAIYSASNQGERHDHSSSRQSAPQERDRADASLTRNRRTGTTPCRDPREFLSTLRTRRVRTAG